MLLVLLAVATAVILTLSFQAAQSTTVPIAQNISHQATARNVAESAMAMTVNHIRTSATWREDFAAGNLPVQAPLGSATFSVDIEDGVDLDGDGTISIPAEGDGDLNDDPTDPVTLTVIGRLGNATHRIQAVLQPGAASPRFNVLYVVNTGGPALLEQQRISLLESWGYTVTTISSSASRATFDQTIADNAIDTVYLSTFVPSSVADKLRHQTIGVVMEQSQCYATLGVASAGDNYTGLAIDIVDNAHYITSPFAPGELTITTQSIALKRVTGTPATDLRTLGERPSSDSAALAVLERGATTHNGGKVPGRRVMLPWSGSTSDFHLNADGKKLLRRAMEWSAAAAPATPGLWAEWFDVNGNLSTLGSIDWDSTPTHTSIESRINWSSTAGAMYTGGPTDTFGVRLRGKITVPADGSWTFYLDSDDGSDLVINGTTVVSNDGLHAMQELYGAITLTAGEHDIVVRVFEQGGDVGLILRWQNNSAGVTKAVVPASAFTVGPAGEEEEETIVPQLVALYAFEAPTAVTPTLVSRWNLDDSSGGGGVAAGGRIYMHNSSKIDAYRSSNGIYGGANVLTSASVTTNVTNNGYVQMTGSARIEGDLLVGVGANPNSVVTLNNSATITGTKQAQAADADVSLAETPPGDLASLSYNSGNITLSSDCRYGSNLSLNNGAQFNINGNIRFVVDGNLTLNKGDFVIPAGSSLTLYVAGNITLNNGSTINDVTSGVGRLTIHMYGSNKDLTFNNGVICGRIFGSRHLTLNNSSTLYGTYVGSGNLTLNQGYIHVDQSSPTTGGVAITEEVEAFDGTGHDVSTGQTAPATLTGTAIAFDGNDAYLAVPHDAAFALPNATVSFWFRTADRDETQGIVSKDATGYGSGGHLTIFVENGKVRARLQDASSSNWVESGTIQNDTWYHVALAMGSGGMRLYLNGTLVDSDDFAGGLGSNTEPWIFGADASNSTAGQGSPRQNAFEGMLDDVRFYDTALIDEQAAALAAGNEPGPAYPPIVADTSGYGAALDLTIADPAKVTWLDANAGLRIDQATVISSGVAATKVRDAVLLTDQITVEVKFTPANVTQTGPVRIATISPDAYNRNVAVMQEGAATVGRLRTSGTGANGTPDVTTAGGLSAAAQQHVILTYNSEKVSLYRNGSLEAQVERTGELDTWNAAYALVLANEPTADRAWLGTLHRVAVWDRGMNAVQVNNLFNGQPPGDGQSDLAFTMRWIEPQ